MSGKRPAADQVSNIFDLIDTICDDFRRQWKAGKRPEIAELLDRVPENARETLFRNLLLLEIRARRRVNEQPTSEDYLKRFSQFRRVVGDAFHQSTSMSLEAPDGTPADEMPVTVDAPRANQLGDYELIRELGRGGFGVVYEARHSTRGNRVALKTLPTGQDGQDVNAERLHRFRREFRSLSEINHPNLVGMQSLEVDGNIAFEHSKPDSALRKKAGLSLAKLSLLKGDWKAMNQYLTALGQKPIPDERRRFLPPPPMEWDNLEQAGWQCRACNSPVVDRNTCLGSTDSQTFSFRCTRASNRRTLTYHGSNSLRSPLY